MADPAAPARSPGDAPDAADAVALYVDSRFLSPWAMSAWVALTEKGLAFRTVPVDLARGAHHRAAYAKRSLSERVPTLVDGDFHLSESSAIAEYLEERRPASGHAPLYPAAPRSRARARQLQAWLRSDFLPLRAERSTEVVFLRAPAQPLSADAARVAARLIHAVDHLLAPGSAHLFGDWCIADTDLAAMLQRVSHGGDPLPPRIADYVAGQWARPTVARWVELAGQAERARAGDGADGFSGTRPRTDR